MYDFLLDVKRRAPHTVSSCAGNLLSTFLLLRFETQMEAAFLEFLKPLSERYFLHSLHSLQSASSLEFKFQPN